jgi:hypothetical protein
MAGFMCFLLNTSLQFSSILRHILEVQDLDRSLEKM